MGSINRLQELLPARVRPYTKVIIAVAVALIVLLWINGVYQRSRPEYTMKILDELSTPTAIGRIDDFSDYFTPRGRGVWTWLIKKSAKGNQSAPTKVVFGKPVVTGDTWTVTMADGEGTNATIKLIKDRYWKFDDIYVESASGKQIELWASYMKEHPILTMVQLNWDDLAGAFIKGFVMGYTGTGF